MMGFIWKPETDAERHAIHRQMVALRAEEDWQNAPPATPLSAYYLPDHPRGGVIIRFPEAIG